MTSPLAGLRVLDLSRLLPGPYMTQMLADMGAEVIKIENPDGGDYLRHLPPRVGGGEGINAVFAAIHRGKRSITLNLKKPADVEKMLQLCSQADVLVESFRPGVMERLGLGPDHIRTAAPRLIYCRISAYGQGENAEQKRAGHDLNYVARAGLLGQLDQAAVPPAQIADLVGGAMLPAIQILAALRLRDQTGQGCTIDAAMIDGAWSMMVWPLARALGAKMTDRPGEQILYGGVPAYACYATADGALSVAALEPKFWEPLMHALQRQDLLYDGLSKDSRGDEVRQILTEIFATKTTAQWMDLLAPLDCCVEPVRTTLEATQKEPAFQRYPMQAEIEIKGHMVALPLSPLLVEKDRRSRQAPPDLGEANAEFLHNLTTGE